MRRFLAFSPLVLVVAGCGGNGSDRDAGPTTLYAMTNEASGNRIMSFRLLDGQISAQGNTLSGGNGTGTTETPNAGPNDGADPLGSQGGLRMSPNRRFLFAVNAGSGSVSSFAIGADGSVSLVDTETTGGASPVSIAAEDSRIYVANVGDAGGGNASVSGFSVDGQGNLAPIPNSLRSLPTTGSRPRGLAFALDGKVLIVSDGQQTLTSYAVGSDGTLGAETTSLPRPSRLAGFDVSGRTVAVAGANNATGTDRTSATIFTVGSDGRLAAGAETVNPEGAGSTRAKFVREGRYFYEANTGGGTLNGYRLDGGALATLQVGVAAGGADSQPTDLDATRDGKWLVALLAAKGTFAVYRISPGGAMSLDHVNESGTLPALGASGLVVR